MNLPAHKIDRFFIITAPTPHSKTKTNNRQRKESSSTRSFFYGWKASKPARMAARFTKWRMVGRPCGQFHGDLRFTRCWRIWNKYYDRVMEINDWRMWQIKGKKGRLRGSCSGLTFCISTRPSESPIIIDDLQARDANIARTLDGHSESWVSDL